MTANPNTDDGSSTDDSQAKLTRREAMQTGGAVATTALLSKFSTGVSQAQQTGTEPRIQLGEDWEIDDYDDGSGNTDLRIRHIPSGAELQYDVSAGSWVMPSVNTGKTRSSLNNGQYQAAIDGLVVPVADGLGVGDAIDPASASTPLQDANDLIEANGTGGAGTILVPPGQTDFAGSLDLGSGVNLIGWGVKRGANYGGSVLNCVNTAVDGISSLGGYNKIDGVAIKGPGDGATTGNAIATGSSAPSLNFGTWGVTGWAGCAFTGDCFQSELGNPIIHDTDAGNSAALLDITGPANHIGVVSAYPTATSSGSNSTIIGSSFFAVDELNIGGTAGKIVARGSNNKRHVVVGGCNYEPQGQQSQVSNLYDIEGAHNYIGPTAINGSADVQDCYWVFNAKDSHLAYPHVSTDTSASLSRDFVSVFDNPGPGVTYQGPVGGVANRTGSTLTTPIVTLADVTKKYSTGSGYDGGTNDVQL